MDFVNTGSDPWLREYEACEALNREILELLNRRNYEQTTSKEYDSISAKIRIRMKQFHAQVDTLRRHLKIASDNCEITTQEYQRRKRQVEILDGNIMHLQDEFSKRQVASTTLSSKASEDRSKLFGLKGKSQVADLGTVGWGDVGFSESSTSKVNEGTAYKSIEELKSDQEKMLKEQDEGLDSLSKIISRQKQIATTISVEVDEQNVLLDDITEEVDIVGGRIRRETNMIQVVGRKDKTWGYWLVILLLFIAIITVAVI